MIWWPIIENLVAYIRTLPEFAETNVHAGTQNPVSYYPCIEIVWDNESNINPYKQSKGSLTLLIDAYVTDDDPAVAYEKLYDVQQQSFAALRGWSASAADILGIALNAKVIKIASAAGTIKPVTGSRTTLEIEWRKKGYENE